MTRAELKVSGTTPVVISNDQLTFLYSVFVFNFRWHRKQLKIQKSLDKLKNIFRP